MLNAKMKFGEYVAIESQIPGEIIVDKDRAFLVFDTLLEAYTKKLPPYDELVPPAYPPPRIIASEFLR